jgi:hypothetical protein
MFIYLLIYLHLRIRWWCFFEVTSNNIMRFFVVFCCHVHVNCSYGCTHVDCRPLFWNESFFNSVHGARVNQRYIYDATLIMLACVTLFSFTVSTTIPCNKKGIKKTMFSYYLTKCTMFTMPRLLLEAGADVLLADNQGTDYFFSIKIC